MMEQLGIDLQFRVCKKYPPTLKIVHVQEHKISIDNLTRYSIENITKIESSHIQKGELLISSRGTNRKTTLFNLDRTDILMSQNFAVIRCNKMMNLKFLQLYFVLRITNCTVLL